MIQGRGGGPLRMGVVRIFYYHNKNQRHPQEKESSQDHIRAARVIRTADNYHL